MFNIGEYYSYHFLYKRAFYIFGDNITTALIPIFLWSILSNRKALSLLSATAMVMSGGKVSLILLIVTTLILHYRNEDREQNVGGEALLNMLFGFAIYFCSIVLSYVAQQIDITAAFDWGGVSAFVQNPLGLADGQGSPEEYARRGAGACSSAERCFSTQIAAAFLQRFYSSLAGLWMTLQGGFPGNLYPAGAAEFADLMMKANPWGINDTFGISWDFWYRTGRVQNPYLRFGSGYGPLALGVLVLLLLTICIWAVQNLRRGERTPEAAFTCFYIVNVALNQAQPWLTSGSLILLAMGFCAAHVVRTWTATSPALASGPRWLRRQPRP